MSIIPNWNSFTVPRRPPETPSTAGASLNVGCLWIHQINGRMYSSYNVDEINEWLFSVRLNGEANCWDVMHTTAKTFDHVVKKGLGIYSYWNNATYLVWLLTHWSPPQWVNTNTAVSSSTLYPKYLKESHEWTLSAHLGISCVLFLTMCTTVTSDERCYELTSNTLFSSPIQFSIKCVINVSQTEFRLFPVWLWPICLTLVQYVKPSCRGDTVWTGFHLTQ